MQGTISEALSSRFAECRMHLGSHLGRTGVEDLSYLEWMIHRTRRTEDMG